MAEVCLRNVSKVYPNGVVALREVELTVQDRECLVIVGPSGSGKTTALRILAGLEKPTTGDVVLDGKVITGTAPAARNVAMVFQDDALYPHMTIAQNLGFGLRMRRTPAQELETHVAQIADRLEIKPLLTRYPHELSGGQRQRVSLGRALIRHPHVCLLDEPFSNLDPQLREQSRGELIELQCRAEATMIYVTHDHLEAMRLGDRIAIIRDGAIQQIDTPELVYRYPANRFVAEFIGRPPMNFVAGHLNQHQFVAGESALHLPDRSFEGAVLLGIRPEDLMIVSDESRSLPGRINRIEFLGRERLAYCEVLGQRWTMLDNASKHRVGDRVRLSFKPDAAHLFRTDGDHCRL